MFGRTASLIPVAMLCACAGTRLQDADGKVHRPESLKIAAPPSATRSLPSVAPQNAKEIQEPAIDGAPTSPSTQAQSPIDVCPAGMRHVQGQFCPELKRRCAKKEHDVPNRIDICHRFEEHAECTQSRIPLDFCMDEFEYPNQRGQKPLVMKNFHEATDLCAATGKRLCTEHEWVLACEGPDDKPFPYGLARSSQHCNIDNRWIAPNLERLYAPEAPISQAEVDRLDARLPSGAKPNCVSDFGVFDLTGNVDEWTLADHRRPRSGVSALKGGAWGHVRNACRPVTTSHAPAFRYYFIGFRCCRDVTSTQP